MSQEEYDGKIKSTATLCAGLIFITGEMLVGECMKPDADERSGITQAFEDCCRAYDIVEIPPWLGLCAALGIYGARRWVHPDVIALRKKLTAKKKENEPSTN